MYKKLARITLVSIGLLSLLFLYATTHLKFDYNFENFFPAGDEDLEFFLDYRESYKNDNDYLLLGIRNEEGIFKEDFLSRLDSLTSELEELELTEQVLSVSNLKNPVIGPLGIIQVPVLRINEPEYYKTDSTRIYEDENLRGTLVAEKIPAVSVLINHRERISKNDADLLMQHVNQLLNQYQFDEVHLAGKAKAQSVYVKRMQEELLIFASASVVLVVIFLTIAYRSWWGVLVPLFVVMLSAIWIAGIMSLTGKKLDVMLVLLPTIIFVVGMSDVVHILTRYIEELRNGKNKVRAIKLTFREVGMATFLTSLTTATGFLTLLTANISPIRDFGIYTAAGVFVAFILAFTLLPAIMVLLKKPEVVNQQENKVLWTAKLGRLFFTVLRNKKVVLIISGIVLALSCYGISQLQINTFLLEDIRDNDPLKKDFVFFDEHFGGSKPFEMAIIVKDTAYSVYDREVLREIAKMEEFLKNEYGAGNLVSPLLLVKGVNRAINGGVQEYYKLPAEEKDLARIRQLINRLGRGTQPLQLTAMEKPGGKPLSGRISGKMADEGSQLSSIKFAEMQEFIGKNINTGLVEFRLTGTSLLIDKNAGYIINNMLEGLGIAFFVIAAIAGLLFRSFRMIIITLIPNLIPLLMIAGIMGLFGVYLKLSTSIIFTIAFGIAVDDTIHFISKLKIELGKGKPLLRALRNTFLSTGKAIIITTIILAGGFLTLILSTFGGTFYTGLLVSLTLVFAVAADLCLLPVLIMMFFPQNTKQKKIP